MQLLKIEIGGERFVVQAGEIEKLLSVPENLAEVLEAGRAPQFLVVKNCPLHFHDLKVKLLGTPSSLFRGSRLLIPRASSQSVVLCEIVTGLVNINTPLSDVLVIEGAPYQLLTTSDLFATGGTHVCE